ncbi:MAG TPA: glycosyltransferase family 2 protein [Gemmatimonadaceae bacterium]|nr:glycosyltransferase family 2 protein [Gemmatimonadaceae bacterium]
MTDRILVFIPCYNCERQIGRVLQQFRAVPPGTFHEILVVDNRSLDRTASVAAASLAQVGTIPARVVRNAENYGLGGSHKAAFAYATRMGFTHVVILHGDDQGSVEEVLPILAAGDHRRFDACLGARFMRGARLLGYSPLRRIGNRVFNALFSVAVGRRVHDLGSGLNVLAASVFADDRAKRFPDDLRFNVYLLLSLYDRALRVEYFPISWREDDQVSNVKLFSQALRTAAAAAEYVLRREHVRTGEHREVAREGYTFDVVAEHPGHA